MSVKSIAFACCPSVLKPMLDCIEKSPIGYRLAKGVFWSMAGAVISRGLMLVASIVVARVLGIETYGEYGMIRSTVTMFGVFAGFGLGLTATKHVAEFRQSDPERAGRIIGMAGLFAILAGGLMALGLFIFAPWLAAYKIERRERPAGDWTLLSMAIDSEATLNNQERGKAWEYRVIATNKAGEGVPSNTVGAVL